MCQHNSDKLAQIAGKMLLLTVSLRIVPEKKTSCTWVERIRRLFHIGGGVSQDSLQEQNASIGRGVAWQPGQYNKDCLHPEEAQKSVTAQSSGWTPQQWWPGAFLEQSWLSVHVRRLISRSPPEDVTCFLFQWIKPQKSLVGMPRG